MTKIKIEVEFEIEDTWCANSIDKVEKDWFWDKVLPFSTILLFNHEIGDTISETGKFIVKEITFNTKEK